MLICTASLHSSLACLSAWQGRHAKSAHDRCQHLSHCPTAVGKTFKKPRRPFEKERLDAELKLVRHYTWLCWIESCVGT